MLERSFYKYREFGLFVLRFVTGAIFLIHGYNKLFVGGGIIDVIAQFGEMNLYVPSITARLVAWGEFLGGCFLLIGFLTREFSLYLAAIMVGAIWTVHYQHGFFNQNQGYEYNLALIGCCLCLACSGGGAGALDKLIFPRARWTFISDPSKIKLEPPDNVLD